MLRRLCERTEIVVSRGKADTGTSSNVDRGPPPPPAPIDAGLMAVSDALQWIPAPNSRRWWYGDPATEIGR